MYLLDTFALICLAGAPDRMKSEAITLLTTPSERIYFSPVNIWEIEIKVKSGKLAPPVPDLPGAARQLGFVEMPIVSEHALLAGRLPLLHKDPFDRMLIAQARIAGLTIVTPEAFFSSYEVPVLEC